MHAIAQDCNHVVIGNHFALCRHVAQRIDRFHTNAGITIVNESVEERLPDQILRLSAIERFESF